MKYRIVVITVVALVLIASTFAVTYKPSIHEVSYYELIEVNQIGQIRANNILEFLKHNPQAKVKDLILVDDIGETLVKILEKRYK